MLLSTVPHRATILIVDDTPSNLKLLVDFLDNTNYKVVQAQAEAEALEIASVIIPDLIVLDIEISETNNFALCRHLKSKIETQDIPIILITNQNSVQQRNLAAVDYVTKPIEQSKLLDRINSHLTIQKYSYSLAAKTKQQQLLFDLTACLHQSLDLEVILNKATEEICKFIQCDRLSLIRHTPHRIKLESQSVAITASQVNFTDLTLSNFYTSREELQKYYTGEIRIINNTSENDLNPGIAQSALKHNHTEIQSQLIAPILLAQDLPKTNQSYFLWGWLVVEQSYSRQWREQELTFLQRLTTQLSIAIKHKLLQQQLRQSNQRLEQLSLYDSLTQVFNRGYFEQQLEQEWNRLKRISAPLSVIFCNVDYFKIYNDTYGHNQGDFCLQQLAQSISSVLKRPADILARYSGSEFMAILPYTPKQGAIQVAEAMRFAVRELQIPHVNSGANSVVTISLGVATTIPNFQDSPNMLVEAALQALEKAKNCGRDCTKVYSQPVAQSQYQQNYDLEWSKRIRYALKENLFSLYAQPITSLADNNSRQHFEILLRLEDRENEIITPNVFLDIAERNSLMPKIDTWVVERLFEQLAIAREPNYWRNYQFSINLSGASLNEEGFLDFLSQKLANYNLPPQLFCFEITEAIAIKNIAQIHQFILDLKNLGCSFALDDFGKGMSSLSYLKNLPVDYLKIDGSFITEVNQDRVSKVMVEAINHLAVGIGLKTVAEFVENQAILDTLRHLKIDYAQGYHLGRPQKFTDLLL